MGEAIGPQERLEEEIARRTERPPPEQLPPRRVKERRRSTSFCRAYHILVEDLTIEPYRRLGVAIRNALALDIDWSGEKRICRIWYRHIIRGLVEAMPNAITIVVKTDRGRHIIWIPPRSVYRFEEPDLSVLEPFTYTTYAKDEEYRRRTRRAVKVAWVVDVWGMKQANQILQPVLIRVNKRFQELEDYFRRWRDQCFREGRFVRYPPQAVIGCRRMWGVLLNIARMLRGLERRVMGTYSAIFKKRRGVGMQELCVEEVQEGLSICNIREAVYMYFLDLLERCGEAKERFHKALCMCVDRGHLMASARQPFAVLRASSKQGRPLDLQVVEVYVGPTRDPRLEEYLKACCRGG